ncbi:MAG: hypothetical protein IKE76_02900 [Clostridia bacterium]|nr:hypothetical protein [Clostridia bacterium]
MVKMINAHTGTIMWVHEDRLDDYLERGHKMAPPPEIPKPAKKTRSTAKK